MDTKYSVDNFSESSVSAAKSLSAELEKTVLHRVHKIVDQELDNIIVELNKLGHSLSLRQDKVPGDIGYIEKQGLRLNIDIIVSSGYDDIVGD